ncbi:MAG: hypothetical protein R8J85_09055 [Mariprofundales bacterium]
MTSKHYLLLLSLILTLTLHATAWGAESRKQESWSIHYLPMNEAESLVNSALSTTGTLAALPSQRLLIVMDDASHLSAAKKLLDQFDRLPEQYRITFTVIETNALSEASLQAAVDLPGHWLQLQAGEQKSQQGNHQQWSLLLLAEKEGSFSVGEIQPYRQKVKQWLAGYGLIEHNSVNLVALTSGFFVRMHAAGNDQVEVEFSPWLARSQPGMPTNAKPELLIGLGTASSINQSPAATGAPLRLNAAPQLTTPKPIRIARAATRITINIGETVEIAANGGESELLSRTLLGRHSSVGQRSLIMRIKVERMK